MVVIAVAGGTGGVGKTIVEAFAANGKHEIKILSRKANPELEAKLGYPIVVVDYDDITATTKTLEDNNIHTVISTIAMLTFDRSVPGEYGLIKAADASKTTKRFLTSDWGNPLTPEQIAAFPAAQNKLKAQDQLRETGLEWTAFHTGYFMDYFGYPGMKTHMNQLSNVLDATNNAAAIPGDGNTPVAFTYTGDVAKYVVASVDLPKWDEFSTVTGDKVTWNEFVRLAEEAKGTKFDVKYDSIEYLKTGKITELPGHVPAYEHIPKEHFQALLSLFGIWFATGVFDYTPAKLLNDEFPDIKPYTVKAFLNEAWTKAA